MNNEETKEQRLEEGEALNSQISASQREIREKGGCRLPSQLTGGNQDDFHAFQELFVIATNTLVAPEQRSIAMEAVREADSKAEESLLQNFTLIPSFSWPTNFNYKTASFEEIKNLYGKTANSVVRSLGLNHIAQDSRFPKYDRLCFIVDELQNSDSIRVREMANYIMYQESKVQTHLFQLQIQVDWWNAHKDRYTNDVPTVHQERVHN